MYCPKHFSVAERDHLHALMRACPLATLVTTGSDGLTANHLPMYFDSAIGLHGTLRAHVARANPLWQITAAPRFALAIFHGAQHYVSPTWYPSKRRDPRVVPTWNYQVVHVHGELRAHDDREWVHANVTELTDAREAGRPVPWQVKDAPAEFLDRNLAAIVGIELVISRLSGKYKLSQNRNSEDQDGVIAALVGEANGAPLMAAMRALKQPRS